MHKTYLFTIVILFQLIFTSCSKNKYWRIAIKSPADKQAFNSGELVNIDATIYDDGDAIMNEWLIVTSIPGNDTIVNFEESEFTFEYSINKSFTGSANTQYKIEIRAFGGHQHWASQSVNITCN